MTTSTIATPRRMLVPRKGLSSVSLYDPAPTATSIDLSDNTNLWGPPPSAALAIESYGVATARYPSPYTAELKVRLARYLAVDHACIVTGCGSDDVLDAAIRAFAPPGGRLAHPDPSFSMIPAFARVNGLESIAVQSGSGDALDVAGFASVAADITYLCTPNNPTGVAGSIESIREIAANAKGLVIIDRAYAEFADDDVESLLMESDNVLFTRTMSKAFGLAGLRIGYGVGAPHIVEAVEKSRGPYKVSGVAESVALAVLDNDLSWVRVRAREVKVNRERFTNALLPLALHPLPSQGNFVFIPIASARLVAERLVENGIAVRVFENLPVYGDALRVTIGPWDLMQRCLDSLAKAVA